MFRAATFPDRVLKSWLERPLNQEGTSTEGIFQLGIIPQRFDKLTENVLRLISVSLLMKVRTAGEETLVNGVLIPKCGAGLRTYSNKMLICFADCWDPAVASPGLELK